MLAILYIRTVDRENFGVKKIRTVDTSTKLKLSLL